MVSAHRRGVNNTQPHAAAGFHLCHFRIGEGAAVGEKSIVLNIIQMRPAFHCRHLRAVHFHAMHVMGLARLELRKDLIRRGEAEVGERDHDFLLARDLAAIPDDQWRRQQKLLLQSIMRVHLIGAATAQREIVVGAASRWNREFRSFRDAVLPPGRSEAMPVDHARLFDMVFDPNAKPLAGVRGDPEGSVGLADAKYGSGLAVHLYVAALEPQHRWRGVARLRAHPRCRPTAIVPARKPRRDSMKISDTGMRDSWEPRR